MFSPWHFVFGHSAPLLTRKETSRTNPGHSAQDQCQNEAVDELPGAGWRPRYDERDVGYGCQDPRGQPQCGQLSGVPEPPFLPLHPGHGSPPVPFCSRFARPVPLPPDPEGCQHQDSTGQDGVDDGQEPPDHLQSSVWSGLRPQTGEGHSQRGGDHQREAEIPPAGEPAALFPRFVIHGPP